MESDNHPLLDELISLGHLIPSDEPGIFGRGEECESIHIGLNALLTTLSESDRPESFRFPPVVSRKLLDRTNFVARFPHLFGSIVDVERTDTGLVMLPAACYPAYPAIAARGPLPASGVVLDLGATLVFRREVSDDPARLQIFHQREMVRMGREDAVLEWRETWLKRAARLFGQLDLHAEFVAASDPFFGRGGRLLERNQLSSGLKFEAVMPIADPSETAVASFNYHRNEFGRIFGLLCPDGTTAYTACVGFGTERLVLALFAQHGTALKSWPASVRSALNLEAADA